MQFVSFSASKNPKFLPAEPFFSGAVDEMFIRVPSQIPGYTHVLWLIYGLLEEKIDS